MDRHIGVEGDRESDDRAAGEVTPTPGGSDTQRMLATLMANLPGMVYRCRNDPEYTMLFVSEGARDLLGVEPAAMVEGPAAAYADLIHASDRTRVWDVIQARVAKKEPFKLLYRISTVTGEEKWVWEQGRGVFADDGSVLFLEGFITDVTAQVRSRRALRESERRFKAITEQATDTVFIADADGRLDYVSPAVRAMFGYDRIELRGAALRGLVASESAAQVSEGLAAALDGSRRVDDLGLRLLRKDGSFFFGEITLARYELGSFVGVAGVIRDVTERRRTERDLQLASHALENAGVGLVSVDAKGRIREVNGHTCALLGYSREELLGMTVYDVTFDLPQGSWPGRWQELKEAGRATFQRRFRAKSGRVFPVEISTRVVDFEGEELNHGFLLDISERVSAEREAKMTALALEHAMIGVMSLDRDGRIQAVNDRLCAMLGFSREEMLGMTVADVTVGLELSEWGERWRLLEELGSLHLEKDYRKKDGGSIPVAISATLVQVDGESYHKCFVQDITERRVTESALRERDEQLRQVQKMESIGRLAGGVAHDYNNMLSVILGHADMALEQIDPALPLHADIDEIKRAAQRSAGLTRQLLAFARRQPASPRIIGMNETISDLLEMLRRLIGEDVRLEWRPGVGLWPVRIDPVQVDQILTNLCVNARDALPSGGTVVIETANVGTDWRELSGGQGQEVPSDKDAPGFVRITVGDDGGGIEPDVLEHVFEPFFTTKGSGTGTGLGLATVYGIVTQNGGFVEARSEPGRGSVFSAYLPRAEGAAPEVTVETAGRPERGQGEVVLLVEDEPAILAMAGRALTGLGYTILASDDPAAALDLAGSHPDAIDLLVTDVVMPGMNGPVLAEEVRKIRPDIRCLFMSGYQADIIGPAGFMDPEVHFLQKPFRVAELAAKIREVLDG